MRFTREFLIIFFAVVLIIGAIVIGSTDLPRCVFESGTVPTPPDLTFICDENVLRHLCPPYPACPEIPACPDLTCPSVVEVSYPEESEVRIAIEYLDRAIAGAGAFYCAEYLKTGEICDVLEARFHLLRALGEAVPPATLP